MTKNVAYNTIIRDEKALNARITSFAAIYNTAHDAAHQLGVSVIVHAAEHGNPAPLNRFFTVLHENDRDAFRAYLSRLAAICGGWDGTSVRTSEQMITYRSNGAFLVYVAGDKAFRVQRNEERKGIDKAKKNVIDLSNKMIKPDGKVWMAFTTRNNVAENKLFGDDDLKRTLAALVKRAEGNRKNVRTAVSEANIKALHAAQKVIGVPDTTETPMPAVSLAAMPKGGKGRAASATKH